MSILTIYEVRLIEPVTQVKSYRNKLILFILTEV